ncbi:glycyl radical protein [Chloroflexota bacterium]
MIATKTLKEIDEIQAKTARVATRLNAVYQSKPVVCIERPILWMESWKETEGQPLSIRWAKAFEKVMNEIPIAIKEGELVVGSASTHVRGAYPYIEFNAEAMRKELEMDTVTVSGDGQEGVLSLGDKGKLLECVNFWKGKTPVDSAQRFFKEIWGSKLDDVTEAGLMWVPWDRPPAGNSADWEKVIEKGMLGFIAEIDEAKALLPLSSFEDFEKLYNLDAMRISLNAAINYALRYAELARELAAKEPDSTRQKELLLIADTCERVPAHPARNFHEAMQSFWFTLLALHLSVASYGESPGRLDQYLYPFYKNDMDKGNIDQKQAAELLGCLWVKFFELISFKADVFKKNTQTSQFINVSIGGQTADGRDATNELSFLILKVIAQVKTHQPHVSLRYHPGTPEEFFLKALETNCELRGGIPAFFNNAHGVLQMMREGISIEEAREDWGPKGCVEVFPLRTTGALAAGQFYNIPKILEITLHNGVDLNSGKLLGLQTGEARDFTSFEDLNNAFKAQHAYFLNIFVQSNKQWQIVRGQTYRIPYQSALIEGCIGSGKDLVEGGGKWQKNFGNIIRPFGHANTANSLAAIKKLVFEEQRLSMDGLLKALEANFEGYEDVYSILREVPKYGNDDDYVDEIMRDLWAWIDEQASKHRNQYGLRQQISRQGVSTHYPFGRATGALPDGRKAGVPFADGSLSPMRGTDRKGPTAVINSALKLDISNSGATLLNQKFSHAAMASGTEGLRKLMMLIKTFFDQGGYHIQLNIQDAKELLDAKKHPEKYPDLIVRVAGFSARFIELAPAVQDEIIERTMQQI